MYFLDENNELCSLVIQLDQSKSGILMRKCTDNVLPPPFDPFCSSENLLPASFPDPSSCDNLNLQKKEPAVDKKRKFILLSEFVAVDTNHVVWSFSEPNFSFYQIISDLEDNNMNKSAHQRYHENVGRSLRDKKVLQICSHDNGDHNHNYFHVCILYEDGSVEYNHCSRQGYVLNSIMIANENINHIDLGFDDIQCQHGIVRFIMIDNEGRAICSQLEIRDRIDSSCDNFNYFEVDEDFVYLSSPSMFLYYSRESLTKISEQNVDNITRKILPIENCALLISKGLVLAVNRENKLLTSYQLGTDYELLLTQLEVPIIKLVSYQTIFGYYFFILLADGDVFYCKAFGYGLVSSTPLIRFPFVSPIKDIYSYERTLVVITMDKNLECWISEINKIPFENAFKLKHDEQISTAEKFSRLQHLSNNILQHKNIKCTMLPTGGNFLRSQRFAKTKSSNK